MGLEAVFTGNKEKDKEICAIFDRLAANTRYYPQGGCEDRAEYFGRALVLDYSINAKNMFNLWVQARRKKVKLVLRGSDVSWQQHCVLICCNKVYDFLVGRPMDKELYLDTMFTGLRRGDLRLISQHVDYRTVTPLSFYTRVV